MDRNLAAGSDYPLPRNLRASAPVSESASPTVGEDAWMRQHGQALEWALERCHIEKKAAATTMGYTDSNVVSRWVYGKEQMQLHRLRKLGDEFFSEFLVALAQTCDGVEVRTQVTLIARRA